MACKKCQMCGSTIPVWKTYCDACLLKLKEEDRYAYLDEVGDRDEYWANKSNKR